MNLTRPLVNEISFTQDSVTPMQMGSTKNNTSPFPLVFEWGDIILIVILMLLVSFYPDIVCIRHSNALQVEAKLVLKEAYCLQYSKTCLKQSLKKNTKNEFSIPIVKSIAECSEGIILSTSIKLPFSIKTLFYLFLSGCLRQVLLY